MDKEFVALYTHQKQKKAKTWHDGVVKHSGHGNKAVLYDEKGSRLDSIYIKVDDLTVGEQIESDRYLILIEELKKKTPANTPVNQSAPVAVTKVHQTVPAPRPQSQARCAGLKRKKSGFVPPRMIQQTGSDLGDNDGFSNSQSTLTDRPQFLPENRPSFYSQIPGPHRSPTVSQSGNLHTHRTESLDSGQGHVQNMFSSSLSGGGRPHQNMLNMYSKFGKNGDNSDSSVNSSQGSVGEDRGRLMSPKPMSAWSVYGSNNSSPSISQQLIQKQQNVPLAENKAKSFSPNSDISSPDFLFGRAKPATFNQQLERNTMPVSPKSDISSLASLFGQAKSSTFHQQLKCDNVSDVSPKSDFSSPASLFGQTKCKAYNQQIDCAKTPDMSPKSDFSSPVSLFGQTKANTYSKQQGGANTQNVQSSAEKSQLNQSQGLSGDTGRSNADVGVANQAQTEVKQKRNMSQIMSLLKRKKSNPDTTDQKFASSSLTEPKGSVRPLETKLAYPTRKENSFQIDRQSCDESANKLGIDCKKRDLNGAETHFQNARKSSNTVQREMRNPFDIQQQPIAQTIFQEKYSAPSNTQESLLSQGNVKEEEFKAGTDLQKDIRQMNATDIVDEHDDDQQEHMAQTDTIAKLDGQVNMQEESLSQTNTQNGCPSQSDAQIQRHVPDKLEAEIEIQEEPIAETIDDLEPQDDLVPQTDNLKEVMNQSDTQEFIAHIHTSGKIAMQIDLKEDMNAQPLSQQDIVPQTNMQAGLVSEAGTAQKELTSQASTMTDNIATCHPENDNLDHRHSQIDQLAEHDTQELTAKSDSQGNNSVPSNTQSKVEAKEAVLDDSFGCFDLILSPADHAEETAANDIGNVASTEADKQLEQKSIVENSKEPKSMNVGATEDDNKEKQSGNTASLPEKTKEKNSSQCSANSEVKGLENDFQETEIESQNDDSCAIETTSVLPQFEKDLNNVEMVDNDPENEFKTNSQVAVKMGEDWDSQGTCMTQDTMDFSCDTVSECSQGLGEQATLYGEKFQNRNNSSEVVIEQANLYGEMRNNSSQVVNDDISVDQFESKAIGEPANMYCENRNMSNIPSHDAMNPGIDRTVKEMEYDDEPNKEGAVSSGSAQFARNRLAMNCSIMPETLINQPTTWINRSEAIMQKPINEMNGAKIDIDTSVTERHRSKGAFHRGQMMMDDNSVLSTNHQLDRKQSDIHAKMNMESPGSRREMLRSTEIFHRGHMIMDDDTVLLTKRQHDIAQSNLHAKLHKKSEEADLHAKLHWESPGSERMDRWQHLQEQFSTDNFGESLEEDPFCIPNHAGGGESGSQQTVEQEDLSSVIKDRLQSYERSTGVRSMSVRRPTGDGYMEDTPSSPGDYTQHKFDANRPPSLGLGSAWEPDTFLQEESQNALEADSPYRPCPGFLPSPSPDSTQDHTRRFPPHMMQDQSDRFPASPSPNSTQDHIHRFPTLTQDKSDRFPASPSPDSTQGHSHQFPPHMKQNQSNRFPSSMPCLRTPSLDSSQEDEIYNKVYRRPMYPSGCKDQTPQMDLQPKMYQSRKDNLLQEILQPALMNRLQQSPTFPSRNMDSSRSSTTSNSPVNMSNNRLRNGTSALHGEQDFHFPPKGSNFQEERESHFPRTSDMGIIAHHPMNDKSDMFLTHAKNDVCPHQDSVVISSENASNSSQQSAFNFEDKENAFGRMPNAFSSASKSHLQTKRSNFESEENLEGKVDGSNWKQCETQENLVAKSTGSKWEDYMPSDASDEEGIDLHKFKDDTKGVRDYSVLEKPAELVAKLEEMKQAKLEEIKEAKLNERRQTELDEIRQAKLEEMKQAKLEEIRQAKLEEMKQANLNEMRQAELEQINHTAEVAHTLGLVNQGLDSACEVSFGEKNSSKDRQERCEAENTTFEMYSNIVDCGASLPRASPKCTLYSQTNANFDFPSSFASMDSFDELVAKENVDLSVPSEKVGNNVQSLTKDTECEHKIEEKEVIEGIPDNDMEGLKDDFDNDMKGFMDKDNGLEGCEETNKFCENKDTEVDEVSQTSVTHTGLPMPDSKSDQVNRQTDSELVEDQMSTHSSPFSFASPFQPDKTHPSDNLKTSRPDHSEECDMQQDLDESLVLSPPEFKTATTGFGLVAGSKEPATKPKPLVPMFGSNMRKASVKTATAADGGAIQAVDNGPKPANNSRCLKLLSKMKTGQGSSESCDFSVEADSVVEANADLEKINTNFAPVMGSRKEKVNTNFAPVISSSKEKVRTNFPPVVGRSEPNCDKLNVKNSHGSDPKVASNSVGPSRKKPDFSIPGHISGRIAAGASGAGYEGRPGYQHPSTEVVMATTRAPTDSNRSPLNSQSGANKRFKAPSLVQAKGREERKFGSVVSPSITTKPDTGIASQGYTHVVSSTQLHFPHRSLVDQLQNVARQVVIPERFPSVNAYKQVLVAAVTEYINTQLLEVAKRYHNALSRVDTSGYSQVSVASGASSSSSVSTPRCQCGAQSKMVMVRKQGANQGRYFYTCSAARNQQCKFFQWADDSTKGGYSKGGGGSRRVIKDTRTLGLHMKDSDVHFYGESQLTVRTKENISKYFKAPKWVRARADPEVMQKKQMVLKIPYKGHSSLYAKDDLWVVSKSLEFDGGSTFIGKSTYHGPTAGQEVEIEPIVGYSPSNWPNDSVCHGILAGNVSSELSCIDNIKDHLQHTSPPIVTQLLNRKGEETSDRGTAHYQAPRMTATTRNHTGFLLPSEHMDLLSQEYIDKYGLNIDQAEAVRRVACMFSAEKTEQLDGILLIHGVFGAGKSFLLSVVVLFLVMVFEQISQATQNPGNTHWKLLISSTTNVAVDRILNGLLDLGFEDFVRVGSVKKIAKSVLPFSVHATGTDSQELRDLQEMLRGGDLTVTEKSNVRKSIEKHRCGENKKKLSKVMVVGATCAACSLSCLNNMEFPLVLLDECSQMTEPASLLPIARFSCHKLILVGDPKQLAPTIQSVDAAHSQGLEQTMFDRLLKMGHMPTLLRTQYRCHPCISAMANKLFYGGMLQDGVTEADRQPLLPCLPTLCLFTVEAGRESCERGSYYNEAESQLVVSLLQTLLSSGLEPATLGVITLYRAQVARITDMLTVDGGEGDLKGVQVSTVDAFQGGEKDVIILSCVRTNNCGFIDSDKRMNVALTRARHHLFIIGHHGNLSTSMLWGKVINHCKGFENGVLSEAEAKSLLERCLESPPTGTPDLQHSGSTQTSDTSDKPGKKRGRKRKSPRDTDPIQSSAESLDSQNAKGKRRRVPRPRKTGTDAACVSESGVCSPSLMVESIQSGTTTGQDYMEEDSQISQPLMCSEGSSVDNLVKDSTAASSEATRAPGGRHRCTDSLDAITFDSDNEDSDTDLPAFNCGKV